MASPKAIVYLTVTFMLIGIMAPIAMTKLTADNGSTWGNEDAASIWSDVVPVLGVIAICFLLLKGSVFMVAVRLCGVPNKAFHWAKKGRLRK